ncbi:hypothetical protein M9458_054192, partial [Cirrhinus mrigala]
EDYEPFAVACEQNTSGLLRAFYGIRRVEDFLRDESVHVPVFASVLEEARESVRYSYDLDGIVVLLSTLSCIRAGVHYLFVGTVDGSKLLNHWHILRKHFDLSQYNANGGIFSNPNRAHPMFKSEATAKAHAVGTINAVFKNFAGCLKILPPEDLARPSVQKAHLNNLGRMNVLFDDQEFILDLLTQAVLSVNQDVDMAILLTITKFGQKDGREFDLCTLVDPDGVINVSYHAACTIQAIDPSVDVLWSRCGLQEVVGARGTLFPVYSMAEAANFQSNIDHMPLDIDPTLRQVLREDGCSVNFVQLYAVTPHCHESCTPRHPVSRVITMCDLHIQKHRRMILTNAERYVDYMEDLARKTVTRTCVRLEAVFVAGPGYVERFHPCHFFIPSMIDNLLETVPMIIPFKDNENGLGLREVVQQVSRYLTSTLHDLLQSGKGQGGYERSWTAFQIELALEEMFFGRPLCLSSRQYSASLGVSASHPDSQTRMRGFLGLGPVGSASVGESPPPLDTWIRDDLQKLRVERIFPLSDLVYAGAKVVGEELVKILLGDLYQRNDRLPIQELKGPERPIGNLCDCRTCLEQGLANFKYFPFVRYWDENRNVKATWNRKDFIELHKANEIPSAASRAAAYAGDVCARIEELGLSYSRNVKKYRDHGMPWLERCIERLPRGMSKERVIHVLVFLSSVGMIQNGDFVSFQKLTEVERDLPVTQKHMQQLGTLSQLVLIRSPCVFRFHEAVPHKVVVPVTPPGKPAQPRPPKEEAPTEVLEPPPEEQPEEELVQRMEPTSVPASSNSHWTDMEVSYIDGNPQLSHRKAYDLYLTRCRQNSTPFRTFHAFKSKRNRLLPDV